MKRIIISVFLLASAICLYAQKGKNKLEVARDAFGQFSFDISSLKLTPKGTEELQKFAKWYASNSTEALYHVYLRGMVSKSELDLDPFIGVKRCKIIIDSLSKDGLDVSFFFITNDQLQAQDNMIGVGFTIDTKNKVMVEPTNEDDYFKDGNKKRKKNR